MVFITKVSYNPFHVILSLSYNWLFAIIVMNIEFCYGLLIFAFIVAQGAPWESHVGLSLKDTI